MTSSQRGARTVQRRHQTYQRAISASFTSWDIHARAKERVVRKAGDQQPVAELSDSCQDEEEEEAVDELYAGWRGGLVVGDQG